MVKTMYTYLDKVFIGGVPYYHEQLSKLKLEIGDELTVTDDGIKTQYIVCGMQLNFTTKVLSPLVFFVKQK